MEQARLTLCAFIVVFLSGCYQNGGQEDDGWDTGDEFEGTEPEIRPETPACGNGILDAGEECDDGSLNSNERQDACRTDCTAAHCGDGVADTGEECDDGSLNSNERQDACRTDCAAAHCGDGVADTGEDCDAADLKGETCESIGLHAGVLTCDETCRFDASGCPCGMTSCSNDPVDDTTVEGPVGAPCIDGTDCSYGGDCRAELVSMLDGQEYVYWKDGYCTIWGYGSLACDIANPETCPPGSICVDTGENYYGQEIFACMDSCSVASPDGVPWENNCDCREGYQCLLTVGVCYPGCASDRECCEIWNDLDSDLGHDLGEVTRLPESECTNTCDPCTFACINNGCPDGLCDIMSPCEHDSDCPPKGRCIPGFLYGGSFPGGMCFIDRCDLAGRECPAGAGCANINTEVFPLWSCVKRCTPGMEPGDPGFDCRDSGTIGVGDAGDYACFLQPAEGWLDGASGEGLCAPGNFEGGTTLLGGACSSNADCVSPAGIGFCNVFYGNPSSCSAYCDDLLADEGICDEAAGGTAGAGACFVAASVCAATCANPGADLGSASTGCPQDNLACVPVAGLDPDTIIVAADAPAPAGFCWPACLDDASCAAMWGGGVCNPTSGVCE